MRYPVLHDQNGSYRRPARTVTYTRDVILDGPIWVAVPALSLAL